MHNQTESFYETLDRCYLNGDMEGAERYLEQCAQSADGPTPLALIEAFNELGAFWRNIGGLSQSLRVFHRALALTQDSFGENCSEYASILNNMAGTYRLLRNFDQSARLYRQALDIYRLLGCETSYTYANVLGNLSLVLREDRQSLEAIQCLETALPILQALPAHRSEIAMAYSNLTTLYHAAGDHDQATRYLCEQGHTKIGFIGPTAPDVYYHNTFGGYAAALKEANLTCDPAWLAEVTYTEESAQECIDRLLQLPELPTAFLCAGDVFSVNIIRYAKERGLRIPEDISIMSLDDLLVSRYLDPPLSTMTFNKELLGEKSTRLLYQIIQGESYEPVNLIKTTPVERSTVKNLKG